MTKYEYLTVTCDPSQLQDTLNDKGQLGWELVTLVVTHEQNQAVVRMSIPQMIQKFILIFKKK